jgi:hypothetical protein
MIILKLGIESHCSLYILFFLSNFKFTVEWEGGEEAVSPLNLGWCSLVDDQGHNHAIIIIYSMAQLSKGMETPVEKF